MIMDGRIGSNLFLDVEKSCRMSWLPCAGFCRPFLLVPCCFMGFRAKISMNSGTAITWDKGFGWGAPWSVCVPPPPTNEYNRL